MKKLHLICNSHIDPVWLWQWEEGAAATLSTFRSAVKLAKQFDYIFCHNEARLYKFIEEYDAELFAQIKELVSLGKWRIMGGWYIQPDCLMPSGETFVRHIRTGKHYFKDNFNIEPKVAINLDSFGHSVGLVQILKKSGYEGYLICRPHFDFFPVEKDSFIWRGVDGSSIKVTRDSFHYSSELGNATKKIENEIQKYEKNGDEIGVCLWGVGNHGGGPSANDLQNIADLQKSSQIEIVHSYPEKYFSEIEPTVSYDKSLVLCFPGCYTSMHQVKSKFVELENKLYQAEKLLTSASINFNLEYPAKEINIALEDLLFSSFHDILPGTCIEDAKQDSVRMLNHGLEIVNKLRAKAFFAFISNSKVAKEGEFPIFVYNTQPYENEETIECEFMLPAINWELKENVCVKVFDGEKLLVSQLEKDSTNLNVNWRLKVVFNATLKASTINRFSIFVEIKNKLKPVLELKKEHYELLPIKFYIYDDNEDPWGMSKLQRVGMGENPIKIDEVTPKIIENGEVRTIFESIYTVNKSIIVFQEIHYRFFDYVDIKMRVIWNENNKILKMHLPLSEQGDFIGQIPFGAESLFLDGRECVAQRFVGVKNKDNCIAIINDSVFGCSYYNNNEIAISLLRSPCFSAHPMFDEATNKLRNLVDNNRFNAVVDSGENIFAFRIGSFSEAELNRRAIEFNQKPLVLNAFPDGKEQELQKFEVDNKNITLETIKYAYDEKGYIIRLLNNTKNKNITKIRINKIEYNVEFSSYEVKTFRYYMETFEEILELID